MQTFIKRFLPAFTVGSVLFGTLAFAATPAFAAGPDITGRPVVSGKVTSVSGDILMVTTHGWRHELKSSTTAPMTAYTVNASGAVVVKDGKTSSFAQIAIGDFVVVRGTMSGTSVAATNIRDVKKGPDIWHDARGKGAAAMSTAFPIQGNGDPVIGGTVSAVSSSTLMVTAKAGQTYTVNAVNAKVVKRDVTNATLANVSVGDAVVVQGAVNGASVTASSILDQAPAGAKGSAGTPPRRGFFGAIGGFFTRLFGFI